MILDDLIARWHVINVGPYSDYMQLLAPFDDTAVDAAECVAPADKLGGALPIDIVAVPASDHITLGGRRINGPMLFPQFLYPETAVYHTRARPLTGYKLSDEKRALLELRLNCHFPLLSNNWMFLKEAGALMILPREKIQGAKTRRKYNESSSR